MAWTEQDYQEIVARLKTESQGVGDVPNAETLTGISSLPAYQEKDGEDIIVRAPLELLAAPALDAADKANAAATKAEENATAAQTAANSANEKAGLAAQAASDANAAKEGAEAATQSANNAASNAEEKATAANTAAQDAEKVANNPTYIGKDHYVYVYNKDTESFDKTDIYCKGEPGSSFRVAGEYDTLEALKSAVPDGSAVDGFMAVGTGAPYDYYAWVNGEWVSQGKIGGIDEAPTDGKAYGRKNGDWAEVPEHLNLTSENLNDINGAGFATQKSPTDYTSPENNYPINENGALIFANANYGHSNQIYGSYLTNRWFARGGGNQQGVRTNWKEFAFTDDVLTKTNTSSFTPTGDYQPATKKYADNIGYGKSLTIPNVNTILHPTLLQGQDAQSKIDELFGGAESFKGVVEDILIKHTRYYFHFDNNFTNCIELGCVNAWRSNERTSYELHFIVVYNTNNIYYTSRIGVIYNVDVNATKYYVAHLVQSDNLTTLTKKTAAEYDAIGSKDANTAYCVTD
nr:MAG: hypothetical protein [Bacteriophage sp.]